MGTSQLWGCLAEGLAEAEMALEGVGQGPHREGLCAAMPSQGTGVQPAYAPAW